MNCGDMAEHLNCMNYDIECNSLLEYLNLKKDQSIHITTISNKIILVLEGEIVYSYGKFKKVKVGNNHLFLLPSGLEFEAEALTKTKLLCFRLNSLKQLCDRFQLERLTDIDVQDNLSKPFHLPFKPQIKTYITSLVSYVTDGLRCFYFHELKLKELFYIFRIYYSKEDMKYLFYPMLSNDLNFSEIVLHAVKSARSIKDLADASGYTISGFNKRFRKVFNQPPYQWLQNRRAERLYKEINTSKHSLKEIVTAEGFSSASELNKFCKRYYGETPGKIRESSKMEE